MQAPTTQSVHISTPTQAVQPITNNQHQQNQKRHQSTIQHKPQQAFIIGQVILSLQTQNWGWLHTIKTHNLEKIHHLGQKYHHKFLAPIPLLNRTLSPSDGGRRFWDDRPDKIELSWWSFKYIVEDGIGFHSTNPTPDPPFLGELTWIPNPPTNKRVVERNGSPWVVIPRRVLKNFRIWANSSWVRASRVKDG